MSSAAFSSNNNNNNRTFKMKQLHNSLLENDELDFYHQNLIEAASAMTSPASTIVDLPELVVGIQNSKNIVMTKPSQPQPQIDPSSIPTVLRRNTSFDSCVLQKNERRVLVIYTGGTIGMVRSPRGGIYLFVFYRVSAYPAGIRKDSCRT